VLARQCAHTGLFGLVCDHMILLSGVLMTKGENWRYATMLLLLMLTNKSIPLGLFYDVNCKFGDYFRRWLASQNKLAPAVQHYRCIHPCPSVYASGWGVTLLGGGVLMLSAADGGAG
jgi:Kyakuja-Dileera-Zisupton transposase